MSKSRYFFAAVNVAEKVYAFGGDIDFHGGSVPSVEVYDTTSSRGWSNLPRMPCPRENFTAVAVDSIIYLLGGYYKNASGIIECWDTAYDVTSQTWSSLSSRSYSRQFRQGHAAAAIGRDIYVVGGYCNKYLDSMHVYNVDSKMWTDYLPPMPTPRNNCAAVAIGFKIVVIGGTNIANRCLNTVEAYDIISQKWTTLPSMNYGRIGCTATTIIDANNILVVGGSEGAICEVFDFKSNSWAILENNDIHISSNRYFSAASSIGHGKALVMGGTGPCGGQTAEIMTVSSTPTVLETGTVIEEGQQQQLPILRNESERNENKLLYIDAANYTRQFFPPWETPWNLKTAQKKVRRLCAALKNRGYTIVAFIDDTNVTEEAIIKWRTRRERDVTKKTRGVPQGALRLVGDMFRNCGVEVRYSAEADNDDTLAYYAHVDSAMILSADRDFLRYRGTSFRIFKSYELPSKKKKITLNQQDSKCKSSHRDILHSAPRTTPDMDTFKCRTSRKYMRGSPSPVTELGNLHVHLRPLRAALYFHFNIDFAVEEEFPVHVNDSCSWDKMHVVADESYSDLLKSPLKAVEKFEMMQQSKPTNVSDEDWGKHRFALRAIVAEICSSYSGSTLLETLQPLLDDMTQKTNETNANEVTKQKKRRTKRKQSRGLITHYRAWRDLQKTEETNTEKRDKYVLLFPDMAKSTTRKSVSDWEIVLKKDLQLEPESPTSKLDDMNKLNEMTKQKKNELKGKQKKSKTTTHYLAWRKLQKTEETKMEKRERYVRLFPDMAKSITRKTISEWESVLNKNLSLELEPLTTDNTYKSNGA